MNAKNNIGLKFAFRSTDIHEIKKTLEFLGWIKKMKVIKTPTRFGKRPMLDAGFVWSGRCGSGSPVFEELFHAFDTRPPVQERME